MAAWKVNISSSVSFDTDKTQLKPALLPVLDSVARSLNQHRTAGQGGGPHPMAPGALAHNRTLSGQPRQERDGLPGQARRGVGPLAVEGRGPNDPIGDNATAEGRALNRRLPEILCLYAVKQCRGPLAGGCLS